MGSALRGAQRDAVKFAAEAAAVAKDQFAAVQPRLQDVGQFMTSLPSALKGDRMKKSLEHSLNGLEVRSTSGVQSLVDAMNGSIMDGVESKLATTNQLLQGLPEQIGAQFAEELDNVAVADAPGVRFEN